MEGRRPFLFHPGSPMPECLVFRVPAQHPADVSEVMGLVASGAVDATEIVAIFGKTEGNGCVNDFTRQLAVMALETALATPPSLYGGGGRSADRPRHVRRHRRRAVAALPRPRPA